MKIGVDLHRPGGLSHEARMALQAALVHSTHPLPQGRGSVCGRGVRGMGIEYSPSSLIKTSVAGCGTGLGSGVARRPAHAGK
jgi:hypothetical protein